MPAVELSLPWDGLTTGDSDSSPYDAAEIWALLQDDMVGGAKDPNHGGVFKSVLNELAVTAVGSDIHIDTGHAMNYGRLYMLTGTPLVLTNTNPATNPRKDYVILRQDWTINEVRAMLLKGTPAGSPAYPSLTQVFGTTWDYPLAGYQISTGGVISSLTDMRTFKIGGGGGIGSLDQYALVASGGVGDPTGVGPGPYGRPVLGGGSSQNPWFGLMDGAMIVDGSIPGSKMSSGNVVQADGTMSPSQTISALTDLTGCSLTLAAGTYTVWGQCQTTASGVGEGMSLYIVNNTHTTYYASAEFQAMTAGLYFSISIAPRLITLASSTTIKLAAAPAGANPNAVYPHNGSGGPGTYLCARREW